MGNILDKLNEVEILLKHQPGRHNQQLHAGPGGGLQHAPRSDQQRHAGGGLSSGPGELSDLGVEITPRNKNLGPGKQAFDVAAPKSVVVEYLLSKGYTQHREDWPEWSKGRVNYVVHDSGPDASLVMVERAEAADRVLPPGIFC